MASQLNLSQFDDIYEKTHADILKYVIIKCHSIDDTKDIMQETYLELWNLLKKKKLLDTNIKSYLIGIANHKIKKHYTFLQRMKTISLFEKNHQEIEWIDTLKDNMDLNAMIIKQDDWDSIWKYVKKKKNQDIPKVFYFYYVKDFTIKEIAKMLNVKESYVKHLIYRTLKELQEQFGNGVY